MPDRATALIACIAALGAALVIAREATYGVALSHDSLSYLILARNLLEGEGYTSFRGIPHTLQPPLYPVLLMVAGLGILPPQAVAGPLNAALFGLTVFVLGRYLRQRIQSQFILIWACAAAAVSLPLTNLASWALAGPPFILFATLALIRTDAFLHDGKTSSLIWAAAFSALAWQTRYIGVALPVAIGLALLLQTYAPLTRRVKNIAILTLIAALPTALWALRNYLLTGAPVNLRTPVDYSLPAIFWDAVQIMASWLAFDLPIARLPIFAPIALAAFAIAAAFAILSARRAKSAHLDWRPCYLFGGFALIYLALLLAAMILSNRAHHGVEHRFMAVMYIPLLVAATVALDRFLSYERDRKLLGRLPTLPLPQSLAKQSASSPTLLAALLMTALALWAMAHVFPHANRIARANSGDIYIGYAAPRWSQSETLRYIRENPIARNVPIHSNERPLVNLHTDGRASHYGNMPRNRIGGSVIGVGFPDRPPAEERLADRIANSPDGTYVIWFKNWWNYQIYDYGAANLRLMPRLQPVEDLADGVIFRVNKKYAPPANPYQEAYHAIANGQYGEPLIRSDFQIYRRDNALIYFKQPCAADDVRTRFILHIYPVDASDLPDRTLRVGFDNRDFGFTDYGIILDAEPTGACLAITPLPAYPIHRIRAGQVAPGESPTWRTEFALSK